MKTFGTFLLVLLGVVACSTKGQGLVQVSLDADATVAALVPQIEVVVSSPTRGQLGTLGFKWPSATTLHQTAGVHVASGFSGPASVMATGYDAQGRPVAVSGSGTVEVNAGEVSTMVVPLTLHLYEEQPDGGAGDGATGGAGGGATGGAGGGSAGTGGSGGGGGKAGGGATGGSGGTASGGADTGGAGGRGGAAGGASTGGTSTAGSGNGGQPATGGAGGGANGGAMAARTWSTAINLQDLPQSSLDSFDVAVSPVSGDAVVVWADDQGVRFRHYVASTGTWSPAKAPIEAQGAPREAHVAVDGSHQYTAVWAQPPEQPNKGVYASRSADGERWTTPTALSTGTVYGDVRLAVSRGGKVRVVWDETTGANIRSVVSAYFDGAAWTAAKVVKTGTDNYDRTPRVGISDTGTGAIVWVEPSPAPVQQDSAWGVTFSDNTFATPALLESYDDDLIEYPDVSVTPSGAAVATWIQRVTVTSTIKAEVWASLLPSGATSWTAQKVIRSEFAGKVAPAEDAAGTVFLAWSQPNVAGNYQLTFSTYAGSTWQGLSAYETDDMAQGYTFEDLSPLVRIARTSQQALVGWVKHPASAYTFGPRVMWRSADGTLSTPVDLGTYDKTYAYGMNASVADDGRAAVVWSYHVGLKDESPLNFLSVQDLPAASVAVLRGVWVSLYR